MWPGEESDFDAQPFGPCTKVLGIRLMMKQRKQLWKATGLCGLSSRERCSCLEICLLFPPTKPKGEKKDPQTITPPRPEVAKKTLKRPT